MIVPDRIGHVVIKVRNLERSREFYSDVMGMQIMMELPKIKMAFFASNGRDHHELGCIEVGADAPVPEKGGVGLSHIAFRLRDEEHLRAAYRELKEKQVPIVATIDHGITKSIYLRDPDGYQIEVYCDTPSDYQKNFDNPYLGMKKLDFAEDDPGFREAKSNLME